MHIELQSIIDRYRVDMSELMHQLVCHQIAVEQLETENKDLKTRLESTTTNLDQLNEECSDLYDKLSDLEDKSARQELEIDEWSREAQRVTWEE